MTTPIKQAVKMFCVLVSFWKLSFCAFLIFISSCNSGPSDAPIPYQAFSDIIINLTLPAYASLNANGGYKTIDGGMRGIIIYRKDATTYLAFERNCSFHPNDACATVEVHSSGLYMVDSCCSSTFSFEGVPTGGSAWRPLQQYQTSLDVNTLTISDQIVL